MKGIIIGAGRGSRLRHLTEEIPKTLVPILGRPMLDGILEALAAGGLRPPEVVFIRGYLGDTIQARYPALDYVENPDWERNNILASLMYARDRMAGGFVSTYADIVYRPAAVEALVRSPHDLTLVCDTAWRRRYAGRTQHPETDAEKLRAEGDRVVELSRRIAPEAASGEFIGVMKASPAGAARLCRAYDEARAAFGGCDGEPSSGSPNPSGRVFREGRTFEKAYLIDLLQHMLEQGEVMHRVDTDGGYMEIDTLEDAGLAETWWSASSPT